MKVNRRDFLAALSMQAVALPLHQQLALAQAPGLPSARPAQAGPRVVIIGAGSGGLTCAAYLRRLAPEISVTLIERNSELVTQSFSNQILLGDRTLQQITHSYDAPKARGIGMVRSVAIDVDNVRKIVTLLDTSKVAYDRLVIAPGVDLHFEAIEGYSATVAKTIPHAWRAGEQTQILKSQLEALTEGGTVVLSIPLEPFSYPLAAYERVCVIAHYLQTRKPRSKLIVLDANRTFRLQDVFTAAFKTYYDGIVEFLQSTDTASFEVASVDANQRSVTTKSGISFKAGVLTIIPPQTAGGIAIRAGCVEGDFCPIDPETFLSRQVRDIHVIGDAAIANDMMKSAFAANNQAKRVAVHIAASLAGKSAVTARMREGTWSFLTPTDYVKTGGVFTVGTREGRKILIGADRFQSQITDAPAERRGNAEEAAGWYAGFTQDMLMDAG